MYDERFCRMWEFYLVVSEISFRNLDEMVFQIQLARRRDVVPLTRDYIAQWEQRFLSRRPHLVAQSAAGRPGRMTSSRTER
jgi:cyclopropane-fatty-acyl-phospholipid synthase